MANLSKSEQHRLHRRYGPWALVTGASSGIGKELATQLASAGLHLLITGRRAEALTQLSKTLMAQYTVEVKALPGDLSKASEVEKLIQQTQSFHLGLVILNAGFGTSGEFVKAQLEQELNMLDLNCRALLMLTHHFSRQFNQNGRGGIILMGSLVGFQGTPNAAHYAATKAYVQSLGEALALELKPQGVDVLTAAPGPVQTGFADRANMQMGKVLRPEEVGIPILKALGRQATVLPGWLTKVLVYSLRTVPRWAKVRIMKMVMGGMTQHQKT
ncbi:MAG: SDR family oxidoreductase [Bacteroidota bacterium]